LLIHNGAASIEGLEIQNFRVDQAEDDLYEGHGIFIINSQVTVRDTVLRGIPKMSLSIFGNSEVNVQRIRVLDGHVGIWMEGESRLRVENSLFSHNDSAAIAAYDDTQTEIYNSVVHSSLDDGIYAKERAMLRVSNSILVNNQPYAIRVEEQAAVEFDYNVFHGNAAWHFPESQGPQLRRGEHNRIQDPQLDAGFRLTNPALAAVGDPSIRNTDGTVASPGLYGGPHAPQPDDALEVTE
jgi:hypothetical protein